MPWKEPADRHSEAMIDAIRKAAQSITNAITQGFKLMADTEAQALADLSSAVSGLSDAITTEIAALTAALAANVPPVNNSPAIEAAVTNINNLAASLKASIPAPAPAAAPAAPAAAPAAPAA